MAIKSIGNANLTIEFSTIALCGSKLYDRGIVVPLHILKPTKSL